MVELTDIVIVTVLAIGATVLVGVLGYLIDKSDEDNSGEIGEHGSDGKGV